MRFEKELQKVKKHIGMDLRDIKLVPYDSAWDEMFNINKAILMERLEGFGDGIRAIHHIGSTAMPTVGVAKPVIDIVMLTSDEVTREGALGGYRCLALREIKSSGFFCEGDSDIVRFGGMLHVTDVDNPWHHYTHIRVSPYSDQTNEQLLFKRFLMEHPEVAAEYRFLKEKALSHAYDVTDIAGMEEKYQETIESGCTWGWGLSEHAELFNSYSREKRDFVTDVLDRADSLYNT